MYGVPGNVRDNNAPFDHPSHAISSSCLIGPVHGVPRIVRDSNTNIQPCITLLDHIVLNPFKLLPGITIYTSGPKGNDGLRRDHIFFSHGLDYPTQTTSCLVEIHHLFLWNASGRCIWCLPSSPIYSSYCYLRRNRCCLSAGKLWVCIYVLGKLVSHRVMKDHRRVPPPVLSSLFQCVIWCTRHTRVDGD